MNKSIESTGKTIDEAIRRALDELKLDRDSVSVEVLEKPKAGFFGIGGSQAVIRVTYEVSNADKATVFLEGLLEKMDIPARPVVAEQEDGSLAVRLEGENLGILIGRRGETLNALQHITNYVINRGAETHVRVVVDIENYRQRREESLQRLAHKTAGKVARLRRNIALEPMNAYERHVIHTALQDWRDVSTYSSGAEPRRCVVIAYTPGGERPDRPRGGRGGRPKKSSPPPEGVRDPA